MSATNYGQWLTYNQLLEELAVPRRTMDRWRAEGKAPKFRRLPNGELRSCRLWVDTWMDHQEAA